MTIFGRRADADASPGATNGNGNGRSSSPPSMLTVDTSITGAPESDNEHNGNGAAAAMATSPNSQYTRSRAPDEASQHRLASELAVFNVLSGKSSSSSSYKSPSSSPASATIESYPSPSAGAPARPMRDDAAAAPGGGGGPSLPSSPARTVASGNLSNSGSPRHVRVVSKVPSSAASTPGGFTFGAARRDATTEDDDDDRSAATTYSRISQAAGAIGSVTSLFLTRLNGLSSSSAEEGEDDDEKGSQYGGGGRPSLRGDGRPSSGEGFADDEHGDGVGPLPQMTPRSSSGHPATPGGPNSGAAYGAGGPPPLPPPAGVERQTSLGSDDDPRDMTYSRRLALFLMKRYSWYYDPDAVQAAEEEKRMAFRKEHYDGGVIRGSSSSKKKHVRDDSTGAGTVTSSTSAPHEAPSLERAWAYFEHCTLPRYRVPNVFSTSAIYSKSTASLWQKVFTGGNRETKMDRAEPGESDVPTKLYSPLYTPLSQMGDFGLGVGLYFSTLRALMILTFLAGVMNIPNMLYYGSSEYSANGQGDLKALTRGSAICTNQTYVPCVDCTLDQFRRGAEYRLATDDETGMIFALKTHCLGAQLTQGMINYGTLFFVFLGIVMISNYQKKMEVRFDEDEQTAQDYSIVVNNPPSDAYDPEEWKNFFCSAFDDVHVTACTVTVGNDVLLHALTTRRERLRQLELLLPVGESLDINHVARLAACMEANAVGSLSGCLKCLHPFGIALDVPALYARIVVLTARIRGLAQREYPATKVFVTFETEDAQRRVLSELSCPQIKIWKKDAEGAVGDYRQLLFRGNHLLDVDEPAEPSAIRWQDLDQSFKTQATQFAVTTFVCLCAVGLVAFIVKLCRDYDATLAAFAIAFFNTIFPLFAKAMTNLEPHASEGGKQSSLYIKIAVFRWVNTGIVITIITPFTSHITAGDQQLIYAVYAIFFAEIITVNALQYVDIGGQLKRHFLGPRAANQERMNLQFQGTPYDLAERYTTVTKVLFLCFYYCAVFPGTFFFAAISFFLTYFFDRFSLMRSWAKTPRLGKQVAEFSRKYFFSTTVVVFAVASSYSWSGFPYDNLCDSGSIVGYEYYGLNRSITTLEASRIPAKNYTVDVRRGDTLYKFCNQNLFTMEGVAAFPALPSFQPAGSEWMTKEQEEVTWIYGWTSVAFLALLVVSFAWRIKKTIAKLFVGGYKPTGRDMNINYSEVASIDAYIPQVISDQYSHPLIACSLDGIDDSLMSWKDPDRPYDYYNLIKDVDKIFDGSTYSPSPHAFSRIKHWVPPEDDPFGSDESCFEVSQLTQLTPG